MALAVVAVVLVALFLVLAGEMSSDQGLSTFDEEVTEAVVNGRTPGLDHLFWRLTLLGNALFLGTVAAAILVVLIVWGCWARAMLIAAGVVGAQIMSSLVKYAYQRSRPPGDIMLIEVPASHSFPSGHAFLTSVVAVLVLFLLLRYAGARAQQVYKRLRGRSWARAVLVALAFVAAFAVVLGVGFSRVYLGVHWLSDVIAGWCLGGAWSAAVLGTFIWWERRRLRRGAVWPGACPLGSRRARLVFGVLLVIVASVAYVVAGMADPLLT